MVSSTAKLMAWVCCSVLVLGCEAARVNLRSVPSASAPLQARVRAFKDLRPESGQTTTYFRNGVQVGSNLDFVMLGDGTRVNDPRDLLPAVDETSPTAKYVHRYEEKRDQLTGWTKGVGISTAVATVATALVGAAMLSIDGASPRSPYDYGPKPGFFLLVGSPLVASVGAMVWAFGAMGPSAQMHQDRSSAFMTYERSLAQRLALDDDAVEDKQRRASQPSAPSAAQDDDRPLRFSLVLR